MGIIKYKPTSAGRRSAEGYDFSDISRSEPEKSLVTTNTREVGS